MLNVKSVAIMTIVAALVALPALALQGRSPDLVASLSIATHSSTDAPDWTAGQHAALR